MRDRDAVLVDNDNIRVELGLYKFVAVLQGVEQRTAIMRGARAYLSAIPAVPLIDPDAVEIAGQSSQSASLDVRTVPVRPQCPTNVLEQLFW